MNEIIDIFYYVIAIFISITFYNIFYSKINSKKLEIQRKTIIIIFCATILNLVNIRYSPLAIKIIFNTILLCIELKLIFKDNWKTTITTHIFIYLFLQLLEIIITNLLLSLNILTSNDTANSLTFMNLFLTILISVIGYIFFLIPIVKLLFQKVINFFIENHTTYNILYIIYITIVILSLINIQNFANSNSISLIFFLCLVFIILFVSNIKLIYHSEILEASNKNLIDYNDNYGKFLDDYKIYKHNINHKLSAMKSYGNKKINALIDDLLQEETNFSIKNNELYNIPNGIKGIVARKLYNKDYNILINNKIKKDPFSKLEARSFNSISECIGIALDNAIEASQETEDPIIIMDLFEDNNNLYLKIGNNYCNSIDLDNIGNKYYSTKNRGSGLGLFSIKQNKLVKEKIEIINDFYYIELQIKKAR